MEEKSFTLANMIDEAKAGNMTAGKHWGKGLRSKGLRRGMALLLALTMVLGIFCFDSSRIHAADTVNVSFSVTWDQTAARRQLDMINEFRTGDNTWYWNSDNSAKILASNLSSLSWDYTLEKAAMQRAVEIAVSFSHTRPNGQSCFSISEGKGYGWLGENLAYGYGYSSDSLFVYLQEEDDPYSGQGHRRNMLNAHFNTFGAAVVNVNGSTYVVQEFGGVQRDANYTEATNGSGLGQVELLSSSFNIGYSIDSTSLSSISLEQGQSQILPKPSVKADINNSLTTNLDESNVLVSYSSEDTSVVTIKDGYAYAVGPGNTSITCNVSNADGLNIGSTSIPVEVSAPAVIPTLTLLTNSGYKLKDADASINAYPIILNCAPGVKASELTSKWDGNGYRIAVYDKSANEKTALSIVATGDILKFTLNGSSNSDSYNVVVKGDVNCNGKIEVSDIMEIQKDILDIQTLTGLKREAASVSGKSTLSVIDIMTIQKHVLGISEIEAVK